MKKKFIYIASLLLLVSACSNNSSEQNASKQPVKPIPSDYDKELLDKAQTAFKPLPELADKNMENVITDERVLLGKILFFDTRLSKTGHNSCNSCHNLATYGVDNQTTSDGDAGNPGDRNSPTVLNAALHASQFWDGRAMNTEEQAGMPILNPLEMAIPSEAFLVKRLRGIELYEKLFKKAFPNDKEPITYKTLRKCIGAFERTLLTPTKFDDYLNGDVFALRNEEREGMNTFMEVGCIQCHLGASVGGSTFQKFGKFSDYRTAIHSLKEDEGRKRITKNEADKDVFKVPGLRNIEKTSPYFHNGSVKDLSEAIKIMGKLQLNKNLSEEQVKSIVTFLKTLTGKLPEDVIKAPDFGTLK